MVKWYVWYELRPAARVVKRRVPKWISLVGAAGAFHERQRSRHPFLESLLLV